MCVDRGFVTTTGLRGLRDARVPRGDVWSADWHISGLRFATVLAVRMRSPFDLLPQDMGYPISNLSRLIAVDAAAPNTLVAMSTDNALRLRRCGKDDFQVWHFSPPHASGWTLLGEVSTKVVAVSPARFVGIEGGSTSSGMSVHIRGGGGERVVVAFAPPSAMRVAVSSISASMVVVECMLPASGRAVVSVPQRKCEES